MLYEFKCKKCGKLYEELSDYDSTGKYPKVSCPECNSKSKIKLVSACSMTFTNPEGTKKYAASHDLRYHHALDKAGGVRDQRKMAEKLSHVGPAPYNNIDDISSGKHFGEVK